MLLQARRILTEGAKDCGMNRHWKLQHSSKLAHNVCTEFVRSGGTSAAKSLKIPGPTTCASSFGAALLLNALELPSLYAFSRQLARYETGVKVPLSEKWQTACDWSASVNGGELSLKQTFVGEECVTSLKSVCAGGYALSTLSKNGVTYH